MEINLERALLWIVLLPLAGALINGVLGRRASRAAVHTVAVGTVAFSFVLGLLGFIDLLKDRLSGVDDPSVVFTVYQWFSITAGSTEVPIFVRFVMDPLSAVMTLVVTGVGLLIHIYATGYMSEDPDYPRFFCYLNLFMGSMLILVLGSSLPVMFIGWEGVGLCSYLLIGFWFENRDYAAAGRKAFVTNRIGDFGVLIGMFLLVQATGSFEFSEINAKALELGVTPAFGSEAAGALGFSVAAVAALFLFLGCTGKSAQIPLFVWLPDAMAGPTPVSALIHAATMVTSGVYLICRLSPVYAQAPLAMATVAVIGAATALLAATIALVQYNMKRVLAYSTVSQLGFMFAAVGCGAFGAGIFHVYTHAFFKACLFLGAGSVMHAVGAHGDADVRQLGGLKKYQPRTRWTFLVSCAAIAGVPLFSGFFSKDEILVGALSSTEYFDFAPGLGWAVFGALVVAATMTAFYMFRLYFLTFENGEYRGGPAAHKHGEEHRHGGQGHDEESQGEKEAHGDSEERDAHDAHVHHDPHESPDSMTLVLVALAVGALVAGYVWVGLLHFSPWMDWLKPSLGSIDVAHHTSHILTALACGTAAAVVGIGLAWLWYAKPGVETPKQLAEQYPGLYRFLLDKWRVDELYDATVLGGSRGLGMVSAQIDKNFIDGMLAWVSATAVRFASFLFTRIQNGVVHSYGAFMMAGILALGWWFLAPHPYIGVHLDQSELASNPVRFEAGQGLGYQYRWDFDSDGQYDTEWQSDHTGTHNYASDELAGGAVVLVKPGSYGFSVHTVRLDPGEPLHLSPEMLGTWQRLGDFEAEHPDLVGVAAHVVADERAVVVRPNGALVRTGGLLAKPDQELRVGLGEQVQIGSAQLVVAGRARATLMVRNGIGLQREVSLDLGLQPGAQLRAARKDGSAAVAAAGNHAGKLGGER